MANAAPEDIHNREGKMEDGQRKKEIAVNGGYQKEDEKRFQEHSGQRTGVICESGQTG